MRACKPLTSAQLLQAVLKRKQKAQATVDSLRGTVHPQVLETLNKCTGEVSAFEEIIDALEPGAAS